MTTGRINQVSRVENVCRICWDRRSTRYAKIRCSNGSPGSARTKSKRDFFSDFNFSLSVPRTTPNATAPRPHRQPTRFLACQRVFHLYSLAHSGAVFTRRTESIFSSELAETNVFSPSRGRPTLLPAAKLNFAFSNFSPPPLSRRQSRGSRPTFDSRQLARRAEVSLRLARSAEENATSLRLGCPDAVQKRTHRFTSNSRKSSFQTPSLFFPDEY